MKTKPSEKLSKRLARYRVLSLTMALLADVSGQVMYFDMADLSDNSSGWVDINVDNNNQI